MSLTPTALDISPAGDWDFAGLFSPISFTATPPSQPSSVTSSSSRSSLAILPAELYRNILRHCSPRDLSRLCLVSRRVGSEARFMLYLDVDLHRSAESRVENWANTLAGSTHLSKILRSLCLSSTFVYPNYSQRYSQHDRTLLALKSALKGAINMTDFIAREFTRISPPKLSEIQSLCHNTIDLSIFDDCRHRFRRFDVYGKIFFTGRKNVDFYLQMSNIVEWTADDTITRTFIPPTLFPNLSTVNLRLAVLSDMRLLKFVMSRRIRRLRMDFAEFFTRADIIERTKAIKVGVAHQTLTHLQIETDGSSSAPDENLLWRPIDIAEDFAVQFPGLKFLSLMASHRNSSVSPPLPYLSTLLKYLLETRLFKK